MQTRYVLAIFDRIYPFFCVNIMPQNISKIAKIHDAQSIVLCSAISEVFLRRLAKQGYIKYIEGSEIIDTREDLIEMGDPDGGGLKEMDEKLKK